MLASEVARYTALLLFSPTWHSYADPMIQILPWNEAWKCEAVPSFYTYKFIFYSHQERSTEENHYLCDNADI